MKVVDTPPMKKEGGKKLSSRKKSQPQLLPSERQRKQPIVPEPNSLIPSYRRK